MQTLPPKHFIHKLWECGKNLCKLYLQNTSSTNCGSAGKIYANFTSKTRCRGAGRNCPMFLVSLLLPHLLNNVFGFSALKSENTVHDWIHTKCKEFAYFSKTIKIAYII